jgi:hypothetical protein
LAESVSRGADHAAVDHEAEEIGGVERTRHFGLNVPEDGQVGAAEGFFGAIGESDAVAMLGRFWCVRYDADASARLRQDLGADRNDQIGFLRIEYR